MSEQAEWVDGEVQPAHDPWDGVEGIGDGDISLQVEALDLGDVLTKPVIDQLKAAYDEKGRHYHTWKHAVHMLNAIFPLQYSEDQHRDLAIAALFHDAIYVPGRQSNERLSAEMARQLLPTYKRISKVENLISATALHGVHCKLTTLDITRDFLDCDILSLTFEWERFVAINNAIVREYLIMFPAAQVGASRTAFLEKWLTKPTIFLGEWYGPDSEWKARCNIERLLSGPEIHRGRFEGPFQ